MHVPTSLINRLREGKAGAIERLRADRASLAVYVTEELLEVAERGNVVVRGWGATAVLRPVPHVVCVRITRPFEKRVAWLQEQLGSGEASDAEEEIRRSDRAHAARMHAQFGVTWGDPLLYDLVLNTDRVSVESCAEQIAALSRRPEFAETEASRAILGNMVFQKPGSGGLIGFTLMRTPRTPAACRRSSAASLAFSSMSTMPRQRSAPTSRIASSMQALSRP